MGAIRLGVPEPLVLKLQQEGEYKTFIETGTYKGGTATWAAQQFEHVITIEGYRPRFDKTVAALAGQHNNLQFIFGDSRDQLGRVLSTLYTPAIFWCDAHWCGEGAHDSSGDECPLVEELNHINLHRHADDHAILIDDARLFLNPPPYPHDPRQWPRWKDLTALLGQRARFITVWEDVIIAVPLSLRGVVESYQRGELLHHR